ncbi:MAG TPA: hypothetical protein VKK79_14140 [Candidatus Lokiarchaeia archaeon]|nr:hypothetical protein [Candidatus Lokiarchaeia archaeon]
MPISPVGIPVGLAAFWVVRGAAMVPANIKHPFIIASFQSRVTGRAIAAVRFPNVAEQTPMETRPFAKLESLLVVFLSHSPSQAPEPVQRVKMDFVSSHCFIFAISLYRDLNLPRICGS